MSISSQFVGFTGASPSSGDDATVLGFTNRPDLDLVLGSTSFIVDTVTGSDGSFTVRHLEAASIQDFLGEMLPVALSDGLIDLHGSYDFRYKGGATTLSAMLPKLGS